MINEGATKIMEIRNRKTGKVYQVDDISWKMMVEKKTSAAFDVEETRAISSAPTVTFIPTEIEAAVSAVTTKGNTAPTGDKV